MEPESKLAKQLATCNVTIDDLNLDKLSTREKVADMDDKARNELIRVKRFTL